MQNPTLIKLLTLENTRTGNKQFVVNIGSSVMRNVFDDEETALAFGMLFDRLLNVGETTGKSE